MKLKYKDIPIIKKELVKIQEGLCPICERQLDTLKNRDICLDHNHINGKIRAVLCRGCNSMEGKVYRAFVRVGLKNQGVDYKNFLIGLQLYLGYPETKYIHPKFKGKKIKKLVNKYD
jgi:hypothetical protein